MDFRDDFDEILLTEDEIQSQVEEIGEQITRKYENEDLLLIGVLRGCIAFISDLMREIKFPVEIDFLAVASYGKTSQTSGVVRVLKDLNEEIEGRNVMIVEDIVDSGLTLNYLMGYLKARQPKSIESCVLLDKPYRREVEVDVDYTGFEVPDEFLVGYGLDYAQKYRNLPYIATIKQEVIEREES
ncbi:MAG: hypoxanthine phosphoribosyltransferase [bacterium]